MKICSRCKRKKPLDEFHKNSSSKDGKQSQCKACNLARVKQWQEDNPERARAFWDTPEALFRARARRYNLTSDQLKALMDKYKDGYPLCGSDNLVVDHDHETGIVRGMLCQSHNKAIGMLGDSVEGVQRALDYLMGKNMPL